MDKNRRDELRIISEKGEAGGTSGVAILHAELRALLDAADANDRARVLPQGWRAKVTLEPDERVKRAVIRCAEELDLVRTGEVTE